MVTSVGNSCVLLRTGEDDLRDVRSAVVDLAVRWKDLGISLGIRLSELNAILSTNPPNDCLREMLALWLKQNYNVRTTPIPLHYAMSTIVGDQRVITGHINSLNTLVTKICMQISQGIISQTQTLKSLHQIVA